MNLKCETEEFLEKIKKCAEDVEFCTVVINETYSSTYSIPCECSATYEYFLNWAENFSNYDNGFGAREVPNVLIVFKDNSWMERNEYDGSEWWEYMKCPSIQDYDVLKEVL